MSERVSDTEKLARRNILDNIALMIGEAFSGVRSARDAEKWRVKFQPDAERIVAFLERNPDWLRLLYQPVKRGARK